MTEIDPPYALLAELTHACPLRCLYCSNPLELQKRESELSTDEWIRIMHEAAALGVLQIHLSGGEPLVRSDLEEIVQGAALAGLYCNLITSGVGLHSKRAQALQKAGLNAVQISVQDSDAGALEEVVAQDVLDAKLAACAAVKDVGLPLCVNIVLHRRNIDRIEQMVEQAVHAGANRIELANAQFYGWALRNRAYLMPTQEQVSQAPYTVQHLRHRLKERGIEIVYVMPDYYQDWPKPCMGGWAQLQITVQPDGTVLPCAAATVIDSLEFETVRKRSLKSIWNDSAAFNAFRGDQWMEEPCRSCERKTLDFGGCRCQAFMLTGRAQAADPVCRLSSQRHLVDEALQSNAMATVVYRAQ